MWVFIGLAHLICLLICFFVHFVILRAESNAGMVGGMVKNGCQMSMSWTQVIASLNGARVFFNYFLLSYTNSFFSFYLIIFFYSK